MWLKKWCWLYVLEGIPIVICYKKGIVFSITCHRRFVQNQFRQPISSKLYLTNFLVLARFIYYGHLSTYCPLNSKSFSSHHLYYLIVELFILVDHMAFFFVILTEIPACELVFIITLFVSSYYQFL
jgi:hypothetical protein